MTGDDFGALLFHWHVPTDAWEVACPASHGPGEERPLCRLQCAFDLW